MLLAFRRFQAGFARICWRFHADYAADIAGYASLFIVADFRRLRFHYADVASLIIG